MKELIFSHFVDISLYPEEFFGLKDFIVFNFFILYRF